MNVQVHTSLEPEELERVVLPCPICKTAQYLGIIHFSGQMHAGDSYYCAQCGLGVLPPTSVQSMVVGFWNRLVRRVLAGGL